MNRRNPPRRPRRLLILTLASVALFAVPSLATAEDLYPPATDVELLHEALYSCKNLARSRRNTLDLTVFGKMLELEREYGVPEQFRGMTLAKGCIESGYTPDVKGDCENPDKCKAVGMLQLWPWTLRFGVDRTDPIDSTRFLLTRVQVGLEGRRLKRRCPNIADSIEAFRIAWLRINRGPLQRGRQRCYGVPHGLKRLNQWKRNIARRRYATRRANRARQRRGAKKQSKPFSAVASFGEYLPVRRP